MPATVSVTVESNQPIGASHIAAFAASAFVSQSFVESEMSEPKPGLVARIISSIDGGRPVILTETELRRANTNCGLHLVVLISRWNRLLTEEQAEEAKMHLAVSFLDLHVGYRLVNVLVEATDAVDLKHGKSTGVHRVVSDFEEFHRRNPNNGWNRDRALFVLDRESAQAMTGSVATILFHSREPVLGLRKEDQQLLAAALKGFTDLELTEELSLQLSTVKKRWAALYDRVAAVNPALVRGIDNGSDRHSRGRQKRHHLLAYLRQHPEELRPVDSIERFGPRK